MRRLPQSTLCRSESCRAPIAWALVRTTGKRMPLDLDPSADGNVAVSNTSPLVATVLTSDELLRAREHGQPLYTSHFVTCPDAKRHRRRK